MELLTDHTNDHQTNGHSTNLSMYPLLTIYKDQYKKSVKIHMVRSFNLPRDSEENENP